MNHRQLIEVLRDSRAHMNACREPCGELGYLIARMTQCIHEAQCDELRCWCESQGLDYTDADLLILREELTGPQRQWLSNYIIRWDTEHRY